MNLVTHMDKKKCDSLCYIFAVRYFKTFIHTIFFEINGENTKELTYEALEQMES